LATPSRHRIPLLRGCKSFSLSEAYTAYYGKTSIKEKVLKKSTMFCHTKYNTARIIKGVLTSIVLKINLGLKYRTLENLGLQLRPSLNKTTRYR